MITIELELKVDGKGMVLNSRGIPKEMNDVEKQLAVSVMVVVKQYLENMGKQFSDSIEKDDKDGKVAVDLADEIIKDSNLDLSNVLENIPKNGK